MFEFVKVWSQIGVLYCERYIFICCVCLSFALYAVAHSMHRGPTLRIMQWTISRGWLLRGNLVSTLDSMIWMFWFCHSTWVPSYFTVMMFTYLSTSLLQIMGAGAWLEFETNADKIVMTPKYVAILKEKMLPQSMICKRPWIVSHRFRLFFTKIKGENTTNTCRECPNPECWM